MKAREKAPEIPAEANKRREPRRRTLLTGRLFTEEGVSVACVIRDLSTNGAAVKLQGAIALPRLISLIDISNGIGHQAQVRWRFRDLVGLRFLRSYDLSSPGSPEAASLAHRWASLRA